MIVQFFSHTTSLQGGQGSALTLLTLDQLCHLGAPDSQLAITSVCWLPALHSIKDLVLICSGTGTCLSVLV